MGNIWIAWVVLLVIMAFFQLVAARQQTKWRFFSAGKHVFRAVWAVLVFGVMFAVGGVPVSPIWAVIFAVVGLALGFVTGPEDLLVEADGTPRRLDRESQRR